MLRQVPSFVSRYRPLLLILLLVFVLRIPSLFEPHRYADEEIYLTLGQGLKRGLVFYRDIHDNKPPFLYLVAAVAGDVFWFRFILLMVHAAGVIFFWKLSSLVFEKQSWAILISTSFFALGSTLPFLEGNITNGENFMIVPALYGTFLLYRAWSDPQRFDRTWVYPLAGVLFAVAFLFKVPIVFDFLGLLLFWWLLYESGFSLRKRLGWLASAKPWYVSIGFSLPIFLSIIYYSLAGAFEPYVRSALLQNVGYLSTWSPASGGLFDNPLVWRGLVVLGVLAACFFLAKKLEFSARFIVVWTAFSMYGALLSSRPYPHYLLEPLVPFSLLITVIFVNKRFINRLVAAVMTMLIILAYLQNGFWYYETFSYYKNFIGFATGAKSWEEYLDFWGVRRNYKIADYIGSRTTDADRIFVWGTEPSIYALTNRLPVGRYTVAYHIVDFVAHDETIAALESTPPKYVVVVDSLNDFPQLETFLQERYLLEREIEGALIYLRGVEVGVHF